MVDTANALSKEFDITIFMIYGNGELEKSLNQNIKVKRIFEKSYKECSQLQKIIIPLKILLFQKQYYKKYIKEDYDVEIAFLEGPITRLFSTKNNKTKKIAWIHNDIAKVYGNDFKANLKLKIDKNIYHQYQTLVFVSEDNKKSFDMLYKNVNSSEVVIYNYINARKCNGKIKRRYRFSI